MENFKCPEVKFPKNVLLMDVAFVNREVASMRRSMSWGLKRELPLIDMYKWLSCLALDGDVVHHGLETQVIFVHESPETRLSVAETPDMLHADGTSFLMNQAGEFYITSVHPAGFTDTPSLFFDLMYLLLDSGDVENLLLLPSPELYGTSVQDELHKLAAERGSEAVSKVCLFELLPAEKPEPYRRVNVAMSLAHVFGITPDDLH